MTIKKHRPINVSIVGVRAFPSDFIGTSGVEVYTEKIVRAIIKRDRRIRFRIYTKNNYPSHRDKSGSITTRPVFTYSSRIMETPVYSFLASIKAGFDQSQIIWYQSIGPALFCWIPLLRGKRVIVTIHGLDWVRKKWSPPERILFSWLVSFVFHQNVLLCGVSRELCRIIQNKTGKPVFYTPPGFTPQRKLPDRKRLDRWGIPAYQYVLYLGRLVPEKRIELLIRSWEKLHRTEPNLPLVIAGGHGNVPSYEKQLRKRFNHPDIYWVGYVFGEDKDALLAYSTCFVLPSETEGLPISVLEALQQKTFCVVTKDIVPESLAQLHNVIVFDGAGEPSLQRCMQKAITIHRKGEYSPKEKLILRQFSWQQTADTYTAQFESLAG